MAFTATGKRLIGAWSLIVVFAHVASADSHDINQDQDQDQHQRQGQDQDQGQAQEQLAVSDQTQSQGQTTSQGNAQTLQQDVQGQGKNLVQSSPTLYLGGAEEGLSVALPWGNGTLGKQSEMTKLVAAHSIVSNAEDKGKLEAQAVKSALRCGLLCRVSRLLF